MAVPKEFARVTKTKNPQYQLYQPGFNAHNGCWLEGSWVTVPKEEWEARKDAHVATYKDVFRIRQHYRDPGVALADMTPAQRQAWEHYSGQITPHVVAEDGSYVGVGINMAGARPAEKDAAWLRKRGYRIVPRVRNGYSGEITSQVEGYDIPADLVAPDVEPVPDPWEHIVAQNRKRQREMFRGAEGLAATGEGGLGQFAASMAMHGLIESEESIVRMEWNLARGKRDPYDNLEEERAEYVEARQRLRTLFGENFDAHYEARRASHNSCARSNLDGSNGHTFSFVLPVFYDDGTHEPWGARDVPWGEA